MTNEEIAKMNKLLKESDLVPTEEEKRLLQDLYDWLERSKKTLRILGNPIRRKL